VLQVLVQTLDAVVRRRRSIWVASPARSASRSPSSSRRSANPTAFASASLGEMSTVDPSSDHPAVRAPYDRSWQVRTHRLHSIVRGVQADPRTREVRANRRFTGATASPGSLPRARRRRWRRWELRNPDRRAHVCPGIPCCHLRVRDYERADISRGVLSLGRTLICWQSLW